MAASRCFIFMYFLLPHWVPHCEASHRPASAWSSHPGISPPHGARDGSIGSSAQSYCLYVCAPNVRWEGQVWVRQKVLFQIGKNLPLRTSKKKVLSFFPPKYSRKSAQRWLPAFVLNGKHHCCQRDRPESSQYRFRPSRRFLSFITFSHASLLIA